jgi:hypothetical protein
VRRAVCRGRRRQRRLERRRELFHEQLLLVRLLRTGLADPSLRQEPDSSELVRSLLVEVRQRVEVAPSGDATTDALQELVLREVRAALRELDGTQPPDQA